MDKKFLGIRIGTFVMAIISLIAAVLIWFYVEYDKMNQEELSGTALVETGNEM